MLSKQLVEEIAQTQQQIMMVQQNIQQIENMVKNTISLPANIMNRLQGEYSRLASLYKDIDVRQGDLQGMRRAFSDLYTTQTGDYTKSWEGWSAEVDRATGATFEQSGRQLHDLQNDAENFDSRVQDLLNTPEGRMEAQQATNQLMAMQIQEARELRAMMATAMQEQAVVNAKREKQDQAAKEQTKQILGRKVTLDPRSATLDR